MYYYLNNVASHPIGAKRLMRLEICEVSDPVHLRTLDGPGDPEASPVESDPWFGTRDDAERFRERCCEHYRCSAV